MLAKLKRMQTISQSFLPKMPPYIPLMDTSSPPPPSLTHILVLEPVVTFVLSLPLDLCGGVCCLCDILTATPERPFTLDFMGEGYRGEILTRNETCKQVLQIVKWLLTVPTTDVTVTFAIST
jgi:hypothetical protein